MFLCGINRDGISNPQLSSIGERYDVEPKTVFISSTYCNLLKSAK